MRFMMRFLRPCVEKAALPCFRIKEEDATKEKELDYEHD
jgi:hypothetical protein